jgi:hypothetical protein
MLRHGVISQIQQRASVWNVKYELLGVIVELVGRD